jgi:transposase
VLTDVLGRPAGIRLTPGRSSSTSDRERGYDANGLRCALRAEGTIPVIPGRYPLKWPIRHDVPRYRDRWKIEAAFSRLEDLRRVATRYDKLALNFLSAALNIWSEHLGAH